MASIDASTPAELQRAFEQGIWYRMSLWPALRAALANNWGGPGSQDKRDWFAGAIAELFENDPTATEVPSLADLQLDVEDRLLQVMQDEFDVNVEDESELEVAEDIMRLRRQIIDQRKTNLVGELAARWANVAGRSPSVKIIENDHEADDDEQDDSDDGAEHDDDTDMAEAPQFVTARRERPQPEIDEHGFQTVVSKHKR